MNRTCGGMTNRQGVREEREGGVGAEKGGREVGRKGGRKGRCRRMVSHWDGYG